MFKGKYQHFGLRAFVLNVTHNQICDCLITHAQCLTGGAIGFQP